MSNPLGATSQTASNTTSRQRVAVVAVHGIGEHEPGASAKSIAELLLRLRQGPDDAENRFTSFKRFDVTIPVAPAFVSAGSHVRSRAPQPKQKTGWWSQFKERTDALDVLRHNLAEDDKRAATLEKGMSGTDATTLEMSRTTDGADHQFMRAQLVGYKSARAPYDTVRYEGQRLPPGAPSAPDLDVHVYEMYWADLSRLGKGAIEIGYELFQLLFHIPHLGRQAVDHGALEYPDSSLWTTYRATHTASVRIFTLVVPLIWMVMAATVLSVVPSTAPARLADGLATAVAILLGAALGARAAYRGRDRKYLSPWLLIPVGMAIGFLASAAVLAVLGAQRALTLGWIALSTAAVIAIANRYDSVRPGARLIAPWLAIPAGVVLAVAMLFAGTRELVVDRVLDVFEVETLVALVAWYAFYFTALASGVLGLVTIARAPTPESKDRAQRAAWTARATLAMATVAVLFVGLPVWALLFAAFKSALPATSLHHSLTGLFGRAAAPTTQYVERIFDLSAGPGLLIVLGVTALVASVLAFTLIPSVWAEVRAPSLDGSFAGAEKTKNDEASYRGESEESDRLGRWLSRGLRIIQVGVTVLFVTVVVASLLNVVHWIMFAAGAGNSTAVAVGNLLGMSADRAKQLVLLSGGWLATSAIGLAAFRGRLKGLMLGFGPVLDAVLDVDNYLREHPRSATPRARIAERYASMLRYLCKWRDATGKNGYDAIVIVSHSQGTVISADYLGFIKREIDPELPVLTSSAQERSQRDPGKDGAELYLFTMGSPLRQLYSAAFPHLYAWVRGEVGAWRQPMPDPTKKPAAMGAPTPAKIGLERWVNAYRSGDYVGRALWRNEDADVVYRPYEGKTADYWKSPTIVVTEDEARTRREMCIGEGAHTHYWDATAKAIAVELERLIADAARSTAGGPGRALAPERKRL